MDRPLHSDRRDFSSERSYYGPGSGGRGDHHRGRGRGRGRGGRGRGGRGRFHQPYRRGPRRIGNRFQAEQTEHDPKQAALRQLLQLLNKVGELQAPPAASTSEGETTAPSSSSSQRAVVIAQSEKITAMTKFLCGPKAEMFLPSSNPVDLATRVGPLVSGLVHCNAVWPLQTPCYAALTLSMHEHSSTKDIANKCLEYTTQCLARDLDQLLLEATGNSGHDHARGLVRVRLALRYLAQLAATGALQSQGEDEDAVLAATNQRPLTIAGLMEALVQAALQASSERYQSNQAAAALLACAVLSSIPYLREILPSDWIQERLVDPLQEFVNDYSSAFAPGIGSRSILLKAERHEDVGEDAEEEDDDDDDDDEEENSSGQVCDSLQDLLRCAKHSLQDDSKPSTFALFTDAPWKELQAPLPLVETKAEEGMEEGASELPPPVPLAFTGEPMKLEVFPTCKALTMLLGGEVPQETQLARRNLNGIVFGRLPIFGPPPEAADEDDEDMEDEAVNERLQAYRTNFGMVDRFFLSEAVRDCLLSHETLVTDAGVERGSIKGVAEQIWSLRHLLLQDDSKGMEYCFVEAILSLVVQCGRGSPFRLMYLARVLLELTRIEPTILSPAIALGVSTLFQDYMPTLVPIAGYNLSCWFAFHLTNTDYQWPASYWKHWEPFVLHGWSNSRGAFVKSALAVMMENLSNPELLVTNCLPAESAIVQHLVTPVPEDEAHAETVSRIYEHGEDASTLLAYLTGDEVGESLTSESPWARTSLLWKALLSPARTAHMSMKEAVESAQAAGDEGAMEQDRDEAIDVLATLTDKFSQYKETVLGVIAKDAASSSSDPALGELFLVETLAVSTSFSCSFLDGCLQACLQHKFVQVISVVKWALGEAADGSSKTPVLRWWEIVSTTIEFGLVAALNSELPVKEEGDGMEVEESSSSSSAKILSYLDPLLSYTIQRVNSLLQSSIGTDGKPNKLTPEQVDLTEGFKLVVVNSHNAYFENASCSTTLALHEALAESGVAGSKLASLIDTGSLGADLLQQGLERL